MNKNKKIYTVADFANYHKGTMPFAEMHALEKDALEDPFLADALEGYAITHTAENDTLAMKKRLSSYNNKASIFSASTFIHTTWFRIAALLIVILGIGYFYYNKYDDSENTLAKNKNTTTDTLQIAETKTPSITASENITPATIPAETSSGNKDKSTIKNVEKPIENAINDDVKQSLSAEEITTAVAPPLAENVPLEQEKRNLATTRDQLNNMQNYSRYYTQQGNVTDLKGGPLQNVSIKDKNSNNGTVTDNNGRFTLKTTDSNAYVSVGTVGYQSKEVLLNNNSVQKITLDRKDDQLQEVVVTGMSAKRKKSETSANANINNALQGKVAGVDIQPQKGSQPSVKQMNKKVVVTKSDTISFDNTAFNEYVKNNLIPVFDENNKAVKGKVVLSFDVNEYGKPQNISILSSSCTVCNGQAISLLKNGPSWLSNILQSKKVEISF